MAFLKSSIPILTISALLIFLITAAYNTTPAVGVLGGMSEIKDVKSNKEIQDLGKYAVDEYNRSPRRLDSPSPPLLLIFKEVVKAEKQVVSGMKYYLTISTKSKNGSPKMFDSEVVVKPWDHSKKMLKFAPSAN